MKILESNFFIFCGLLMLAFILFGNGIGGNFVFDDRSVIVGNPMVENISGIAKVFVSPYYYARPQSGLYRPLTLASFNLDWHVFSGKPYGFHLVNVFLHAISSFLVFLVILKLKDQSIAIIGSLLFLFLPIHVEAVTSIVGRAEILSLLFVVGALIFSLQKKYILASVSFLLGLLSKEMAVAFIPIFIFLDFFRSSTSMRKLSFRGVLDKLGYFVPALVIYAVLRYMALGEYFLSNDAYSFFNPVRIMDFFPGLRTAFKVLYLYIQKTISPSYFSSDYSYNQITAANSLFYSWQALAGVAVFVIVIYLSISRRNNLIGLGAFIFLSSYLIISNLFFKTGTIMAERLMYMPSLGLVMLAASAVKSLELKVKSQNFKFKIFNLQLPLLTFYFLLLTLFAWYGWVIIDRNKDWLSEKSLFESAYAVAPNSVVNITNMASILFREGQNKEALEKIETALNIEPKNSPTLHLAGQIYKKMGENKIAEEFWLKAIQAQPDYLYPYLSLGALYYQKGDFKSGETVLLKAEEIYNTPNVISLLAFNKIGLKKYSEAINLIEKGFGQEPNEYELRFILGVAYLKLGDYSKARELLLELKDPALTEDIFFQNLKNTTVFDVEI